MVIDTDLKQMDTAGLRVFLQVFQFITESVEKKSETRCYIFRCYFSSEWFKECTKDELSDLSEVI